MKSRIFLIAAEDLKSEICNSKNKFRKTDRIYIFSDSEDKIILTETMRKVMDGKETIVTLDKSSIIDFFRDKNHGDETMYFIGPQMQELFQENINEILIICAGAAAHPTFGVNKVAIQSLKQETIGNQQYLDLANVLISPPVFSGENIEMQAKTKDCIESIPKIEDEKTQEISIDSDPYDYSYILKGLNNERKVEKKIVQRVDDAKAMMFMELRNRFNDHVSLYLNIELQMDQYYKFMVLILKSETAEEFNFSWQCSEPTVHIVLKQDIFVNLRMEAAYYFYASNIIYGEDVWNY